MSLLCLSAEATIGNCIRPATRLLGGRICRSMPSRSREVFGSKHIPHLLRGQFFMPTASPRKADCQGQEPLHSRRRDGTSAVPEGYLVNHLANEYELRRQPCQRRDCPYHLGRHDNL